MTMGVNSRLHIEIDRPAQTYIHFLNCPAPCSLKSKL